MEGLWFETLFMSFGSGGIIFKVSGQVLMYRSSNIAARVFERQIRTPAPGASVSYFNLPNAILDNFFFDTSLVFIYISQYPCFLVFFFHKTIDLK